MAVWSETGRGRQWINYVEHWQMSIAVNTIQIIQFGRIAPCKFWGGGRHVNLRKTGVCRRSAIVRLDRMLVNLYTLSIVATNEAAN